MTIKDTGYDHDDLRKQAEKIAKEKAAQVPENLEMTPEAVRQMLHELQVHQIELEMQNDELRRTQAELETSQARYCDLYNLPPVGYFTINEKGVILEANLTAATLLGIPRTELVKQPLSRFILPEDQDIYYRHFKKLFESGSAQGCDLRMLKKSSPAFWAHLEDSVVQYPDGVPLCRLVMNDITERKLQENELKIASNLIPLTNTPGSFRESMSALTAFMQDWTGFEAIGIRLRAGDDYPYYETRGFPTAFVQKENHLCAYDQNGQIIRDGAGNPVLECMCGNILSGRFDSAKPFFTAHGSFWTNSTSALLAGTTEADRQARTRNRCNGEGYESVALIPLRSDHEVFGLLQFNDRRPDRFTPGQIASLERVANYLAIALSRRQTSEALQESEKRFRSTIMDTDAGYFFIDKDGIIRNVNTAWVKLYKYSSKEEIIGQHFTVIQKIDDVKKEKEFVEGIIQGNSDFLAGEFSRQCKDGSVGFHTISARPVESLQKVIGIEGFIIDTTERMQAENALRQAHDELEQRVAVRTEELRTEIIDRKKNESELKIANMRLQALYTISSLDNIDDRTAIEAILKSITQMTDSEYAFYGFINEDESVMTIHGWSGEAMAGCSLADKPSCFVISESGMWAEAVRQRKPLILNDYSAPHAAKKGLPEGHVPIKNLMVVPFFANGKITSVSAVANRKKDYNLDDIDQTIAFLHGIQTIKESKLAAAEKADLQSQKTESLSRMAGAIAHHFNNQLAVIIGNLEITMENRFRNDISVENLTEAMIAARKATEISSLMLTYLGQTVTSRESMDICEACRLILPLLMAAHPKKITMEVSLPSPGPIIIGNKNQIQQILKNLVTNAWESINNNREGSIRLKIKKVFSMDIPTLHRYPIEWQPGNNTYACLEVSDTGCGISDKNIGNLFDPFFSSKFTGRGLGLSVVLGIIRSHDGAITVTSEPGRGSIFCIFLPVSEEEVASPMEKESKIPAIEETCTVLLVEDEASLRKMVMAMLKSMGMTVLEAKDGVEAVEVFRMHKDEIGCVLCDLTMPRMNGWETLTAIRNISHRIPVILASGYDEGQVMEGYHSERPDAFLHKPFSIKDLKNKVREALDRKIIG